MGKMSNKDKALVKGTIGVAPGAAWDKGTPDTRKSTAGYTPAPAIKKIDVENSVRGQVLESMRKGKQQDSDDDSKVLVAKELYKKNYEDLTADEEATVVRAVQTASGLVNKLKESKNYHQGATLLNLLTAAIDLNGTLKGGGAIKDDDRKTIDKASR
jgi:hypothetical protein